jgi:hypothetical protein
MCLICTSCTDSFEEPECARGVSLEPFAKDSQQTVNASGDLPKLQTRRTLPSISTLSDDELREIVEEGYNGSPVNGQNLKLLFNKQLANLTGLVAGNIYITRYEEYHKIVNLNGSEFYDDEEYDECGLRKQPELQGGNIPYDERGYNTISVRENQMQLTTYLIHVISDMSGRKLDIYYPCIPSKIKWHYFLYN